MDMIYFLRMSIQTLPKNFNYRRLSSILRSMISCLPALLKAGRRGGLKYLHVDTAPRGET